MRKPIGVGLVAASLVLAGGLLLTASRRGTQRRSRSSLSGLSAAHRLAPSTLTTRHRHDTLKRHRQPHENVSDADQVARLFLHGWLGCTYHRARCSHIAGMLPAYAAALAHQHARSLPTPAELAARPRILSLQVLHGCERSATAVATYRDGMGGDFDLHINLIRQRNRWRVFDVADAAPHIPLPEALNHGLGRC